MILALGSALLALLNLASAALIAERRRAGWLGVRARMAEGAGPGPPAVEQGWRLAGLEDG